MKCSKRSSFFSRVACPQQDALPAADPGSAAFAGGLDAAASILAALLEPTAGFSPTREAIGVDHRAFSGDSASQTHLQTAAAGTDLSHSRSDRGDGVERTAGAGVRLAGGRTVLSAGRREVGERDAEGNAWTGHGASATIGLEGAALERTATARGVTRTRGVGLDVDGDVHLSAGSGQQGRSSRADLRLGHDTTGLGVSMKSAGGSTFGASFDVGEDTFGAGISGGTGPLKLGMDVRTLDDKQLAGLDADGTDIVSRLLGRSTVAYGLLDAFSATGSAALSNGWLGIGASASMNESSSIQVHTTVDALASRIADDGALRSRLARRIDPLGLRGFDPATLDAQGLRTLAETDEDAYRALLAEALGDRVQGRQDLGDLELSTMAMGEAFTLRSGQGATAKGSVTVGLTVSLGVEGQEAEQLTVARTAADRFTVHMAAMDADALTGSIGVGGAVGLSATDRSSHTSEVEFTATAEELVKFQQTGLLPGALERADPEAIAAWRQASDPEALRETTGRINRTVLDGDIDGAVPEGVRYTRRRHSTSEEDQGGLSVLGWSMAWGSAHTRSDEQYRGPTGVPEWARSTRHDEDNVFAADETTSAVFNPEGETDIEMAFFSQQALNTSQRQALFDGGGLRDEVGALAEAFRTGAWTDAETSRVQLGWTADQVAAFRTATQRDPEAWSGVTQGLTQGTRLLSGGDTAAEVMQSTMYRQATGDVLAPVLDEWMRDGSLFDVAKRSRQLAEVSSPEQFGALSEAEQTLVISTYAMDAMSRRGGDPWMAATFAMASEDADVRNRHMRQLFHVIERHQDDTHALLDFVEHLERADYVDAATREQLLDTLRVEVADGRVDSRAAMLMGLGELAEDTATTGLLDDSADLRDGFEDLEVLPQYRELQRERADNAGDWLLAARRAGGPKLVEQVIRQAERQEPGAMAQLLLRTERVDPGRAEVLRGLLGETALPREALKPYLDALGSLLS